MTEEILKLIEKCRICKIKNNNNEYKYLQRRIWKEIRVAKKKWLTERCIGAKNLNHIRDSSNLHKKVKEIAGKFDKRPIYFIRDDHNKIITDSEELLKTWKTYGTNIFNNETRKFNCPNK